MVHDARRLPMSIHHALRALASQNSIGSMAQMTAQAGRVAELDAQLEQALQIGRGHSLEARQALQQAQLRVGDALEKLAREIDGVAGAEAEGNASFECVREQITGFGARSIQAPLQRVDDSIAQLQAWVKNLKAEIAGPLEAARALAAKSTRKRPRIMIVDDDDIMRKLMSKILVAQDYEVEAVSNAFAAIRSLQSELPDLILMDVQLPSIDGIQLTRRLKEIEAYAGIPVLMLTGRGERQVILDSRAAGAVDFIVKPFERELLLQKLQRHVLRKPAVDGVAA
jgi:CheY-like chemotaxis protein